MANRNSVSSSWKITAIGKHVHSSQCTISRRLAPHNRNSLADVTFYSFWGIFWIDVSSDEAAEEGFARLGGLANKDKTFEAGMHWLSNSSQPWLLILDNADEPDMTISRYFPAGGRGHIIITTKNANNRVHATIGEVNFQEMEEEDAITLLLKTAGDEDTNYQRRMLAKPITATLGYLALALTHAGAAIRRKMCTLESYLRIYLKHMIQLPPSNSSNNHDRSIITSYEIPYQRLEQRGDLASKDAIEILHVFAFLHFQDIPSNIFRKAWNQLQTADMSAQETSSLFTRLWISSPQAVQQQRERCIPGLLRQHRWEEIRVRRALAFLSDLSFVYYDDVKQLCSMHPFVHLWARQRLSASSQEYWLDVTTALLANSISSQLEASGRAYRRLLVPHLGVCFQARHANELFLNYEDDLHRASRAEKVASVYAEIGDWKKAREIYEKIYKLRANRFGLYHHDTLKVMTHLGQVYWDLFDAQKVVPMRLKIYDINAHSLGEANPLTLKSLSNLSNAYWLAGDRLSARDCGTRAVNGLMETLGPEDPDTLMAMFYLARTQLHLGQCDQAQRQLEKVLDVRIRYYGLKHPDTLMAMEELAMAYHGLGRMSDAEEKLIQVLLSRRSILGEEHAYTLWAVNDLAKVYADSGRGDEALEMLKETVQVASRTLGPHHIGTRMTKFNIAHAFNSKGDFIEAENILRKMIPNDSSLAMHPDFMAAKIELAWTCRNLGRLDEAEEYYRWALQTIKDRKGAGVNHRWIQKIMEALRGIYEEQNRIDAYEECKRQMAPILSAE